MYIDLFIILNIKNKKEEMIIWEPPLKAWSLTLIPESNKTVKLKNLSIPLYFYF
jgi:hypothetical protein